MIWMFQTSVSTGYHMLFWLYAAHGCPPDRLSAILAQLQAFHQNERDPRGTGQSRIIHITRVKTVVMVDMIQPLTMSFARYAVHKK